MHGVSIQDFFFISQPSFEITMITLYRYQKVVLCIFGLYKKFSFFVIHRKRLSGSSWNFLESSYMIKGKLLENFSSLWQFRSYNWEIKNFSDFLSPQRLDRLNWNHSIFVVFYITNNNIIKKVDKIIFTYNSMPKVFIKIIAVNI